MAYYVSAVIGRKRTLVAGPWRRHGDAVAHVERVRRWARVHTRDGADAAWGTAHHRTGHVPGRLNGCLDVSADRDGYLPPAPSRGTIRP